MQSEPPPVPWPDESTMDAWPDCMDHLFPDDDEIDAIQAEQAALIQRDERDVGESHG